MEIEEIQKCCLGFPGVTEDLKWGSNMVFSVAEKMFASISLDERKPVRLSFKADPDEYEVLIQQDGIIPAPYLARAKWVMLERLDALDRVLLTQKLKQAYELVFAKLTKKKKAEIAGNPH